MNLRLPQLAFIFQRQDQSEYKGTTNKFAILLLIFLSGCASIPPNPLALPNPIHSNQATSATPAPLTPTDNSAQATATVNSTPKSQRDLTYCTMDGAALKMDLYFPPQTAKPTPVALFVHGGGWTAGDKTQGNLIPFDNLASQGFLVAAVNYRLAPKYKFPAMIQDVKCAVRYLRANAAKLNIDPNRIGAWGGSAGGHLVALLGTTDASAGFDVGEYIEQSSRVQAVVDMFGPTDLNAMFPTSSAQVIKFVFSVGSNPEQAARLASPVTYVSKDDPPFLILQGDKDRTVPPEQSQILYDRLQAAGVPAALVMVKNAGHGFVPAGGAISPTHEELVKMIADFFKKNLQ